MILDHVDQLELPDAHVRAHQNELRTLAYLWEGLNWLNSQLLPLEARVRERVNAEQNLVVMIGNAPALRDIPQGLVACAFHWYAVSACNYVRLAGWLAFNGNAERAGDYVKRVITEVKSWRDKVGAHFAVTTPGPTTLQRTSRQA